MRESRSVVNGVFAFVVFLTLFALLAPGHARSTRGPRFLRVSVEDRGHDGEPERIQFSVPWVFVRGGLNAAATGRLRRELDVKMGDKLEASDLKGIWTELSGAPEGTEVVREGEGHRVVLTRRGEVATIRVTGNRTEPAEAAEETSETPSPTRLADGSRGKGIHVSISPVPPIPPVPPAPPVPHVRLDGDSATIVLPLHLLAALAGSEDGLTAVALVDELRRAMPGDLVDVSSGDGHVRIWLE